MAEDRISIIIDTDTNNELDDQHALAYAFFNSDVFDIRGVTVNHTAVGSVDDDYQEAERVMRLCGVWGNIPLLNGVDTGVYSELTGLLTIPRHEGYEAVDFIIAQAHSHQAGKLVLVSIGKLTNIALALKKDPAIIGKIKVIWLGGNYLGRDGRDVQHNLVHDPAAYNAVIEAGVEFTMVTVRYGESSGTSNVAVHIKKIQETMPGLGPSATPVTGRHGGSFTTFGDYSVDLFANYTSGTRPLHDVVAIAILKNQGWGDASAITAPRLQGTEWNGSFQGRTITLYENFESETILADFFEPMQSPSIY